MNNKEKQRGQSLILVTVFLGIISLTVLFVFNAGMLSKERISIQNTADAAAFSSAVLVARDLNFQAYTNRAMVANQVAIGQYVGLSSWIEMLANTTDNLNDYLGWIPYIGWVIQIIDRVMTIVNNVAQPVLGIATTATNFVEAAISRSQQFFRIGMATSSLFVVREVIEANDPKINFNAVSQTLFGRDAAKTWVSYSKRVDTGSNNNFNEKRREEFHGVVNESRDGFSKKRSYDWFRLTLFPMKYKIEKAGGSDLVDSDDQETWTAMDTVSLTIDTWYCHPKGFGVHCGYHSGPELPLGWASKYAGEDYNMYQRRSNKWGNSWGINPTTSSLAASDLEDNGTFDGLRDFYDIATEGFIEKAPSVRVILGKSESQIRTSGNTRTPSSSSSSKANDNDNLGHWGVGSVNIEEKSKFAGSEMSAIGKAEAYFKRPSNNSLMNRRDGHYEFANLYSPYWQARLIDSTRSDKRIAYALVNL